MLSLPQAAQEALAKDRIVYAQGVQFDFSSGTYAFWSGSGPLTWSGLTFQSSGSLLEISDIPASGDLSSQPVTVRIRAVPEQGLTPDLLASIENEIYHQRPVTIYIFIFDPDTRALVNVYRHYAGFLDKLDHVEDEGSSYLVANLESRSRGNTKTGYRMRSTTDQKSILSGDEFFQNAASVGVFKRPWGRA